MSTPQNKSLIELSSGLIVPILLVLIWEWADRTKRLPPSLSAAPTEVVRALVMLSISWELPKHALFSLGRLLTAVSIGTFGGILSGVFLASLRRADRLISPMLLFFAPVPVVVWMPFMIMFFGTGEVFKIALAAFAAFLIVHIHTYQAVRSIEVDYIELANIYEKNYWEKMWHVLLPFASPAIFTAIRITVALAWIVIFFVEYSSARQGEEGLGWFINDRRDTGKIEEQYAGVILLAIIGFIVDTLLAKIQKNALDWTDSIEISITQEGF